jgi:hypothetical protein
MKRERRGKGERDGEWEVGTERERDGGKGKERI